MTMTFDDLLGLALQLSPSEKQRLKSALGISDEEEPITREMILAEHAQQVASGAFIGVESLRDKYANPNASYPSDEELTAYLRQIRTEWEEELDDYAL